MISTFKIKIILSDDNSIQLMIYLDSEIEFIHQHLRQMTDQSKIIIMRKFVIKYGIIGACISITLGLLNWFFIAKPYGVQLSQMLGYLSIIAALLCIPMGIKYYRDKLNNGQVTFKEGFKIGIGITLVASLVMAIYSALFFAIAGDDFKAWQEKWAPEQPLDQADLQMVEVPDLIINPWFQGLIMFLMVFLIGFIMNMISSLALKKIRK